MRPDIIIGIDSFKGCLSSREAGEAAAKGARKGLDEADVEGEVHVITVADGGEGMAEAIASSCDSERIEVDTRDALGRPLTASYWRSAEGERVWIDMAAASGLPLIGKEERNPMLTSTYGTGIMLRHAIESGAREIMLGLGGSATNDAGLGILQALGWQFTDREGRILAEPITGADLQRVSRIDSSKAIRFSSGQDRNLREGCRLTLACDVSSPLYGPDGAAYIFAPQKGADLEMVRELDRGLRHIAEVVREVTGNDCDTFPGGGAAGGCGATLRMLAGGDIRNGAETVIDITSAGIDWNRGCLVITGEGHADRQTLMGKAPAGMLHRALRNGIPSILVAGMISDRRELMRSGFSMVADINAEGVLPGTGGQNPLDPDVAAARLAETVRKKLKKILFPPGERKNNLRGPLFQKF